MVRAAPYLTAITAKAAIQAAWTTMAATKSHFQAGPGGPAFGTGPGKRQAGLAAGRSVRSDVGREAGRDIGTQSVSGITMRNCSRKAESKS
jgi:hypothetical protein